MYLSTPYTGFSSPCVAPSQLEFFNSDKHNYGQITLCTLPSTGTSQSLNQSKQIAVLSVFSLNKHIEQGV